jgi:hypothetical protein
MRIPRIVCCTMPGCAGPAEYKIACRWRHGLHGGLKTYEFSCEDHLAPLFRDAEARWLGYEPVGGETVEELGVYRLLPGRGDRELQREHELELRLREYSP